MQALNTVIFILVFAAFSSANTSSKNEGGESKVKSRTRRDIKSSWPVQCVYTSMINQDGTWFLYRPILDCCYRCRKPHRECMKETHPWFCYRETFACSTKCIVKSHWHGKNVPQSTAEVMQSYPLKSYYSLDEAAEQGSKEAGDQFSAQSPPVRSRRLPCVGHVCYGDICFRKQLCYKVDSRYLKNVPVKF